LGEVTNKAAMSKVKRKFPRTPDLPSRRAVRIASWVTIALTVALVVLFVAEIASFDALKPRKPNSGESKPGGEQVVAALTTIAGFDKEQQPFIVNAKEARQDLQLNNIVHLTTVDGQLKKKDGTTMTASANTAVYDTDIKVIDLEGNVRLTSEGKFVADMDKARVFLVDKHLTTNVPVTVVLKYGKIVANGAEITDNGKRVLFFDRVKATYSPADSKENRQ
jgi:LPS export ABC transporter protein LptC